MRKLLCVVAVLFTSTLTLSAADQADKNADQAQYTTGKIVRVDADKGVIVVKTGTGDAAKEMEYRVAGTTKYFGTDKQPLTDGIKARDFREGTQVWFRAGTGDQRTTISELRFANPGTGGNNQNPNK